MGLHPGALQAAASESGLRKGLVRLRFLPARAEWPLAESNFLYAERTSHWNHCYSCETGLPPIRREEKASAERAPPRSPVSALACSWAPQVPFRMLVLWGSYLDTQSWVF